MRLITQTSVPVSFLERNQTCIGSFLPFMDTGPLCSRWNCGSEFSGDIRHLKDREWGQGEKQEMETSYILGRQEHSSPL